jgi:hypothetical protein
MPDLKSELQKLADLKFDDDGGTTVITLPTTATATTATTATTAAHLDTVGVSQTLFNIIRDNPGNTRSELVELARKANIKDASSSSLIVQFTKRGLIEAANNGSVSTYTTIGSHYVKGYIARNKAKKVKPVAKVTPTPTPAPDNAKLTTSVPQLLDTLSIVQARELYDALKKIFGA